MVLREGLVLKSAVRSGRTPFHVDPVEAGIVNGAWAAPHVGHVVTSAGGTNWTWEAVSAETNGTFPEALVRGGYVYIPLPSEREQVMLLKAAGHNMVYVNGEPRTGDPYQNGSVALPIRLRAETNDLLFAVGRGSLRLTQKLGQVVQILRATLKWLSEVTVEFR